MSMTRGRKGLPQRYTYTKWILIDSVIQKKEMILYDMDLLQVTSLDYNEHSWHFISYIPSSELLLLLILLFIIVLNGIVPTFI